MDVRPIKESDTGSFRDALQSVASERKFLLTLSAPPEEAIKRFVQNNIKKGYPQYVAVVNGEVIGWADFVPIEKESLSHTAHLGMGVRKEHRGNGVGTALLTAVTDAALARGFMRLELEVFSNNTPAVSLYKKHGFQLEGTKQKAIRVDGAYIDAHIMAKLAT